MLSLPANKIDDCIDDIIEFMNPGDTIADLGNSLYLKSIDRYNRLLKKNISFLGKKTNQETLETISNARFTISATRVYEGQPTLLTESSKLKIPTIFPVYGGISSFLPNTSSSFCFQSSN